MSMLPLVFRDMMSMMRPLRMLENHLRMTEEFFNHPYMSPTFLRYQRQPREAIDYQERQESVVEDKEKFQVKLDVQNFSPEEIIVKTVDGNSIEIEAKHEEKSAEKGFISRHFIRRFVLPHNHNLKSVVSNLSSDGILTVTAPKMEEPKISERVIPITHTGPERQEAKAKDESSQSN